MKKINISCSERKLSEGFPLNLSPNNIGKYLNQYVNYYLIYKLKGFDLKEMRVIKHNFRLYPYDTSFYRYNKEELLKNFDIVSMTLLIGRLKEEAYKVYYDYFHQQVLTPDHKTQYQDEDIGIFATNHKRSLVFIMNLSGRELNYKAIKKIPAYIEKYVVENQHHEPYPGNDGVWYTNPSHLNHTMLYGNGMQL